MNDMYLMCEKGTGKYSNVGKKIMMTVTRVKPGPVHVSQAWWHDTGLPCIVILDPFLSQCRRHDGSIRVRFLCNRLHNK